MKGQIGRSVPRKDARDKVTGRARYLDDLRLGETLYGATVRSSAARGRIRRHPLCRRDSLGRIHHRYRRRHPRQQLRGPADRRPALPGRSSMNHPEEAVLLLAHPDKHLLEQARRPCASTIEPLPAIYTIEDSLAKKQVIWGEDNSSSPIRWRRATWMRLARRRLHRRGRVRDRRRRSNSIWSRKA